MFRDLLGHPLVGQKYGTYFKWSAAETHVPALRFQPPESVDKVQLNPPWYARP